MQLALEQAERALWVSDPNPRVGCVLVNEQGLVIGAGHTQAVGQAHAEIMALRDAAALGHDTRSATAYVTLEPCAHHGRTGPCCEALIAAGIRKVVASIADPNPLVAGQGFEKLRQAGIEVDVGLGAAQARELNIGFFSRMLRQKPWVRLKVAASLDGKTALTNGISQWVTSAQARADGHAWRARASAVLTGAGTVLGDNPRLDVRAVNSPRQPHVAIVDSRLQTPPDAHLFLTPRERWIWSSTGSATQAARLEERGAVIYKRPNAEGKVDLAAMLSDLAQLQVNELHVEAGARLNGSLLREGLVDELLIYVAPKWLGEGLGMATDAFATGALQQLSQALELEFHSVERMGPDLRIVARISGRDSF